jgi:hypothetical protein
MAYKDPRTTLINNQQDLAAVCQALNQLGEMARLGWIAADVCAVLGIQNPTDALSRLDPDEKGTIDSNYGRLESTFTEGQGPPSFEMRVPFSSSSRVMILK